MNVLKVFLLKDVLNYEFILIFIYFFNRLIGGGSGGGGFGSGNRSSFGGRTGSNDTRSRPEYGSFVPRGRRGNARRGRDDDDLNGFVF